MAMVVAVEEPERGTDLDAGSGSAAVQRENALWESGQNIPQTTKTIDMQRNMPIVFGDLSDSTDVIVIDRRLRSKRHRVREPSPRPLRSCLDRWCNKRRLRWGKTNWTSPPLQIVQEQMIPGDESWNRWKPSFEHDVVQRLR